MEYKRLENNVDDHAIKLVRGVASLFKVNKVNNKFSDVRIKVENKIFYCHKIVLQLNSEYFGRLSFHSGCESLQHIKSDEFFDVLRFMYTGEIHLSKDNVELILSAARQLCMSDLEEVCFRFMNTKLDLNTVQLFQRLAAEHGKHRLERKCLKLITSEFTKLRSSRNLSSVSSDAMKLMLSDDSLVVKSETEVCDTLLKWLQVQWDVGNEVHPDQMLTLIRWSGVSIEYIKSELLPCALFSDKGSKQFLRNVITYLTSGIQFRGLQTFRRPSTRVENCMITLGLLSDFDISSTFCRINLQHPETVTTMTEIPTTLLETVGVCLLGNTCYITGSGASNKGVWKWNLESGWIKRTDMLQGRFRHCSTGFNSRVYVFGGTADNAEFHTDISSIEVYNPNTDKWTPAGELVHAVNLATCVSYKNSIYVFGGRNSCVEPDIIQMYNPMLNNCIVMLKRIPHSYRFRKEPLMWETSVILIGAETCFIYNFESQIWQERKQFAAGVLFFAATLDNAMVYVAGGGVYERGNWEYSDEIKYVPVLDIIEDKPAVWKQHAKLPRPARILAFTSLPPVSLTLLTLPQYSNVL